MPTQSENKTPSSAAILGGKPSWLAKRFVAHAPLLSFSKELRRSGLHTVCEEARCPNLSECFTKRIATIMIMGDICTRSCKFCAVKSGRPELLDADEPKRVAQFIRGLSLRHVVLTSVDRDDLPDLGASHFAKTIAEIRNLNEGLRIEVLTPDFQGREALLDLICEAKPHIFNHNLETVRRLTPLVRSVARYDTSLSVLNYVKNKHGLVVKSGLMLGLGEAEDEIEAALCDLREAGCDMITLGQYLPPTRTAFPVSRYVSPGEFERWESIGRGMGFLHVFSAPYVRSSYSAEERFDLTRERGSLNSTVDGESGGVQ